MPKNSLALTPSPIKFGTDGWRGVLGVDFTLEKLLPVAAAAAQELAYQSHPHNQSRQIIIGYDRRFLAAEMAEAIASAVRGCELQPLLTDSAVVTPSCSWAVVERKALGALIVTASHNPPEWLGLKIKGPLGGSVEGDFTKAVEQRLAAGGLSTPFKAFNNKFNCRIEHLDALKEKFDISSILKGLTTLGLNVIVDPMHGSAAGCMQYLFNEQTNCVVREIRTQRDPLFGGNPPEPLAEYINELIHEVKSSSIDGKTSLGIIFDGDGDRIAAVDENGRYCSTQLLMPLLIDHLSKRSHSSSCIVKTVSGCDLMRLVAESNGLEVLELPVGFKYIASEMLSREVLIGGEESGGIGFGSHIPERDALFTSLVLLEALADGGKTLGQRIDELQNQFGEVHFDRIDILLENIQIRNKVEDFLRKTPPKKILGKSVQEVITLDGFKFRLDINHWLMFRFSGTEPLLRIYCEGQSNKQLTDTLDWAMNFIENI
tara:strand:- start:6776 stop:8236 length:1461 start_codon:yes stop_codon:yes gene_type:complete